MSEQSSVIILISANVEWKSVNRILRVEQVNYSPYGEWFKYSLGKSSDKREVIFFHGGWGKISAAASTQFVIDYFKPGALINLGTCGGFEGAVKRGTILLVDRTVVYDIIEQMGDMDEHIAHYSTEIDLDWLKKPYPIRVTRSILVSGDRDILASDIPELKKKYAAIAADWESGAIAFVAARNQARLVILRGVSDLVGNEGGEAYGKIEVFEAATLKIMQKLLDSLEGWLKVIDKGMQV